MRIQAADILLALNEAPATTGDTTPGMDFAELLQSLPAPAEAAVSENTQTTAVLATTADTPVLPDEPSSTPPLQLPVQGDPAVAPALPATVTAVTTTTRQQTPDIAATLAEKSASDQDNTLVQLNQKTDAVAVQSKDTRSTAVKPKTVSEAADPAALILSPVVFLAAQTVQDKESITADVHTLSDTDTSDEDTSDNPAALTPMTLPLASQPTSDARATTQNQQPETSIVLQHETLTASRTLATPLTSTPSKASKTASTVSADNDTAESHAGKTSADSESGTASPLFGKKLPLFNESSGQVTSTANLLTDTAAPALPAQQASGESPLNLQAMPDNVLPATTPAGGQLPNISGRQQAPDMVPLLYSDWSPATTEFSIDTFHQLRWLHEHDQQRAELQLHPAELGRLSIHIGMKDGQASVQLVTHTPEAKALLEQALPQLRDLLAQSGMKLADSQVSQEQHNGNERPFVANTRFSAPLTEEEPMLARTPAYRRNTSSHRIDHYV